MSGFLRLKILNRHQATIWSVSWSSYGEFLISSGSDGIIFIWGPISILNFSDLDSKKTANRRKFSKWNNLSKFESFHKFKTYRNTFWLPNSSQFCVCTFSGISFLCNITFFKKKKSITMKKQYELIGPLSEIKNCIYSPDGNFVCVSARNKTIWTWKKNLKNNFNFFFIIKDHDSDLKCLRWYPRHKYLITASYNGIIKFYQKKKKNLFNKGSISAINATIWNILFTHNGKKIYFCTSQGDIGEFLEFKQLYCFYIFSTISIIFFHISIQTSSILYTNNEENINILFRCKYLIKEKIFHSLFGGVSKFFRFKIEKLLICPHVGDTNSFAWHPNDNNIIASCGDDLTIYIWYYSQVELIF